MSLRAEMPGEDETLALYDAVGWSAYTREPDRLRRALSGSHTVLTARVDGRLVGLARTVSDGETVCYVQDVLVHPDRHRQGVGTRLVTDLLDRYRHCRAFVLTTDADGGPEAVSAARFYRALGLRPHAEHGLVGYWRG
ncbi:GNAT family N-acetyltransferase [Nakamurella deserti]|uniref:GNAT family N-acetyltransferase n=1 Tax=Nakamurella deserti TaxID=2164074 RepID=UPI00197B4767|nr:GNAT family N-acetyltransferase [Nakamurella deserti]